MAPNTATLLVRIAEELYDFGCATPTTRQRPGDPPPDLYTYAVPKNNPSMKRPLPDIRADLAAVYQAQHGEVPSKSALGDAMMVLEGKARQAVPVEADDTLTAMLGGSKAIASQLVKLAHEHYDLGVTTTGEAFAVPKDGPRVARLLRGGRRSLRAALAKLYYERSKTAAGSQALADAMLVLEGEADELEPTATALRAGRTPIDGRLVLDLGRDDGQAAVVGADGWDVTDSPVLLWRTNATLPLPAPTVDGDLDVLKDLLNVADDDWPLIVAWLVSCLIPDIPHPVLLLKGEHGTAKSTAARMLTSLVDPCASQLRTAPRNVEDWAVACAGSWVTCLDNVSDLQPWLQDAICRAVTGDGMLRRQLYTDSDVSVLAFKRVVALTSIDPGKLNGDLADRLLTVELERITDEDRMSEEDLVTKWRAKHPAALGGLLDTAAEVLQVLPAIRRGDLPRMADFARLLLAVDKVLGTSGFDQFAGQAGRTAEQVADSDNVIVAIRAHITNKWDGRASDLLELLTPDKSPKDWPANPSAMGGALSRAAPVLRRLGWTVDRPDRTARKRLWTLAPPSTEEYPADPSQPSQPSLDDARDTHDASAGTSSHVEGSCRCPCHRGGGSHDGGSCPGCNETTEPL